MAQCGKSSQALQAARLRGNNSAWLPRLTVGGIAAPPGAPAGWVCKLLLALLRCRPACFGPAARLSHGGADSLRARSAQNASQIAPGGSQQRQSQPASHLTNACWKLMLALSKDAEPRRCFWSEWRYQPCAESPGQLRLMLAD